MRAVPLYCAIWILSGLFPCQSLLCKTRSREPNFRQQVATASQIGYDMKNICVELSADVGFTEEAVALASKYQLEAVGTRDLRHANGLFSHSITLSKYEHEGVESFAVGIKLLSSNTGGKTKSRTNQMKPVCIDFCPPLMSPLGRRSGQTSKADMLIKAVAPRTGFAAGATVCDLTAGLGQDSILIANAGAQHVHMVERDPIMGMLLLDAYRRLHLLVDAKCVQAVNLSPKLSLTLGDSLQLTTTQLKSESGCHCEDIVYLDPMFPSRSKSSLVKKNMQVLHSLLGTQDGQDHERESEEKDLLETAFKLARHKVVVKRPNTAAALGGQTTLEPSYSVKGPTNRWDIYIKQKDA